MTSLTVCTPWWNAPELAAAYWRAIGSAQPDDRVIVVDNGSDRPVFAPGDERFRVVRMDSNAGFSAASNAALALTETDAALFLNNDVVMTNASWLDQIRRALKPRVLVGAHLRTDAHAWVDGRPMPYLDGWCLAGMRDDLLELGGFDESFEEPSYYGDNDLCARAKAAGFKLVQVPVGLRHLSNYTSRRLDVTGVSARNRERYQAKARELLGVAA